MNIFSGPQDVYEALVENAPPQEEKLLGLLAFACIEEQRAEWARHQTARNGAPPTAGETIAWYRQRTPEDIRRAKDEAERQLKHFAGASARRVWKGETKKFAKEVNKFWPQFRVNLAANFAFAFIVLMVALYIRFNKPLAELVSAWFLR